VAVARTLGSVVPAVSSPPATSWRSASAISRYRATGTSYDPSLMQIRARQILVVLLALVAVAVAGCGSDDDTASSDAKPVILATTTSTQDSGLLDVLVPAFEKESGL
jgi:hypothetical protein